MVFAFAPIVGLLLGLSAITVPWDTLFLSVLALHRGPADDRPHLADPRPAPRERAGAPDALIKAIAARLPWWLCLPPWCCFSDFRASRSSTQPLIILLLAVPILIQVFFNSGLAYLLNRAVRSPHCVAGPSALIGASNFFELAVATAIVLFGFESGRGAGHRGRRADRGAGDARRRGGGQSHAGLVRAPRRDNDLRSVRPRCGVPAPSESDDPALFATTLF